MPLIMTLSQEVNIKFKKCNRILKFHLTTMYIVDLKQDR